MSTHHSIPRDTPRFRIGLGTVMTAFGVLIAIAVTIIILALTGANHTTATIPATASQAAGASTPQTHYLGPRQDHAAPNPDSGAGSTSAAVLGNPAPRYTCLGVAQSRCHR